MLAAGSLILAVIAAAAVVVIASRKSPSAAPARRVLTVSALTPTVPKVATAARNIKSLTALGQLSATKVTASNPSGVTAPHGNVPGWKQIFLDDFPPAENVHSAAFASCEWGQTVRTSSCASLPRATNAKWFAYPDGERPLSGPGVFEPSGVLSIAHHMLTFSLGPDPITGKPQLAALEAKLPIGAGAVQYAAVAVRFKAQPVKGYDLSFELWPEDNQGGTHGNIEFPGGHLAQQISAVTYRAGIPGAVEYQSHKSYSGWHTAVTEWTHDELRFFLDGKQIGSLHGGIPTYPMNWILQVNGESNAPADLKAGTGKVDVAWAAAYIPSSVH